MDDLARFCCQNPGCTLYGRRNAGNLSACARYGKHTHIWLLYCNACKYRLSERKGTALFHSHLHPDKALAVLDHLAEGCGVRSTGRLVASTAIPSSAWHASLVSMPMTLTTSTWLFPPRTREVQLDEKGSFVFEKQKNCNPTDPADDHRGDWWDHVAYDPEHRLVLAVVPGARVTEDAVEVVEQVEDRTATTPGSFTSDAHPAYEAALGQVYGTLGVPARAAGPGRPPGWQVEVPAGVAYATVQKEREEGRVVAVLTAVVLGTWAAVTRALGRSTVGTSINTSLVERQRATDRGRNAREARKTYRFSKDWRVPEAMTSFTMSSYNFCWVVRTLPERREDGRWRHQTPAMSAGLADHVWSLKEWLTFPTVQQC